MFSQLLLQVSFYSLKHYEKSVVIENKKIQSNTYNYYILFKACHASNYYNRCHDSLCKWKPNGARFVVNRSNPGYFATCSNGIATCEQCPGNTVFDDKIDVCVNPKAYKPQHYDPTYQYRPHHVYNQYKAYKTYKSCK